MSEITADGKPVLNTQDRIAIAQCLNLAVEVLKLTGNVFNDEEVKNQTKRFYKIKEDLEREYCINENSFEERREVGEQKKLCGDEIKCPKQNKVV